MLTRRGLARIYGLLLFAVLLLAACSSDETQDGVAEEVAETATTPAAVDVSEQCRQGAQQIVERFQLFLDDYGTLSPEEFLAQEEITGLAAFQDDVGQIMRETANQSSTLCNLDGLQEFVDQELGELANAGDQGLLANYLISSIRFGGNLERADVQVGPDDDIQQVLSLLDSGSTMTLEAGVYRFENPLLVAREVAIVGQGQGETVIQSSAADAAIAAFGTGLVRVLDLSIEHVGDAPASVVLAFGAPVGLENVELSGAIADEQTGGGNGVLLSEGDTESGAPSPSPDQPQSYVLNSRIHDNMVAGIAITGELAPRIEGNEITKNALCGLCFLERSAGVAAGNTVRESDFGIQVGDQAAPMISDNEITNNSLVGMVLLGANRAVVERNEIAENAEVGIALQESANTLVAGNIVGAHPFGITVVNDATPVIQGNTVTGADVAIQVGEQAVPTVEMNELINAVTVGILHRDTSGGVFRSNRIIATERVAVLVEGQANPTIEALYVEGAEVGVSYRETASGTLKDGAFLRVGIGVQLEDEAVPTVAENSFDRPTAAAVVARSTGGAVIEMNTVTAPETLAFGAAGPSDVIFKNNAVTGGETAASLIEESVAQLVDNTFTGQVVAVQIGENAAPDLIGNDIVEASGAAVVYRETSSGTMVMNTILNPGSVGIQVIDQASPELTNNLLVAGLTAALEGDSEGSEEGDSEGSQEGDSEGSQEGDSEGSEEDLSTVAILYAGEATGEASNNEILGFSIGVQVGESASPDVLDTMIDGGAVQGVGFLIRDDASGRYQANTTTLHSIAFQIGGSATPEVIENTVTWAADVAFLVRGDANPTLEGNQCPAEIPGIALLEGASPTVGENACAVVQG